MYGIWLWRKSYKYVEMLQIDHGVHLVGQEEIKRIFPIEGQNQTLLGTESQRINVLVWIVSP